MFFYPLYVEAGCIYPGILKPVLSCPEQFELVIMIVIIPVLVFRFVVGIVISFVLQIVPGMTEGKNI